MACRLFTFCSAVLLMPLLLLAPATGMADDAADLRAAMNPLRAGGNFVAVNAEGTLLLTDGEQVGRGWVAQVWDARTFRPVMDECPHTGRTVAASFGHDGGVTLLAVDRQTVRLLDAATGKRRVPELGHDALVVTAGFSPDASRVVTACADGTTTVWDAATGRKVFGFKHRDAGGSASFSPDGTLILTTPAKIDGAARVWDAATGEPRSPALRLRDDDLVTCAAFSPDGRRVVTGEDGWNDPVASVWDVRTGRKLAQTGPLGDRVNHAVATVAFMPDGAKIVTVTDAPKAGLWDAGSGEPLELEPSRQVRVSCPRKPWPVAFGDNGRLLFAGDCVWDVATGRKLAEFGFCCIPSAAFNRDGRLLVHACYVDGPETHIRRIEPDEGK